jgi:hypothetical protein
MQATVRLLFDEGRHLPKWREGGLKIHRGEFLIEEKYDDVFKRSMVFARLMPLPGEGREPHVIEPLRNAVVVVMKADWLRVQGFEYDDFSKKNFYQTWHVEFDK